VNAIAGLVVNTFADEFFHLATWVLVLAASIARDQGLAAGTHGTELEGPIWARPHWLGIFNVVEGSSTIRYLAFITCGTNGCGPKPRSPSSPVPRRSCFPADVPPRHRT
jgi:hypothetical protein